jgi:hypothetical protein
MRLVPVVRGGDGCVLLAKRQVLHSPGHEARGTCAVPTGWFQNPTATFQQDVCMVARAWRNWCDWLREFALTSRVLGLAPCFLAKKSRTETRPVPMELVVLPVWNPPPTQAADALFHKSILGLSFPRAAIGVRTCPIWLVLV